MFRLFIAFVIILFEMVGISFLRAAAKPLPRPLGLSVVRAEEEGRDERIAV